MGSLLRTRDERGATATEYALMATLIALAILTSVQFFGEEIIELLAVPAEVFDKAT